MAGRKVTRMGRKRTKDKDLPTRVYLRRGAYYFVDTAGVWHPLGKTKPDMLRALADLLQGAAAGSFSSLVEKYRRLIMPKKSPKTQKDQGYQLTRLEAVFGRMPAKAIRRGHVAEYRDSRPPVAANRELSVLSHIFARGMEWELVDFNPCVGIERNDEEHRDRYITDDEFDAVFDLAKPVVQAVMLLAYFTGQREGDLLKLRRSAITDTGVEFKQGKTRKKLLVQWTPGFKQAIEFALALPKEGVSSTFVITQPNGQPYSESGFQTAWQRHIRQCHKDGVVVERFTFHDIRAKAGTDGPDEHLLGHSDSRLMRKIYRRKPEKVAPTQ